MDLSTSSSVIVNENNFSFNSWWSLVTRANTFWQSSVSLISITLLIVFKAIIQTCLYGFELAFECNPFTVFGLFNVLNAFERFLHTSNWSVNKNKTRGFPRPDNPSESSVTSHRVMKVLWDDTKSGYKIEKRKTYEKNKYMYV